MIYLDYNATTPLCDAAREAMMPYLDRHFGNPSSVHAAGRETRAAIDDARDKLAALLRVKPHELIFTGGGTESCNLAVLGLARCPSSRGGHIISNKAEHHAVLNTVEHLEKREGFEVTWPNVSRDGIIDVDQLADSIRPETRLVSIMTANNETGVIQPMREISRICRERGVLLHSDMVQSFGKIDTDLSLVDAASFAAHKFYGRKRKRRGRAAPGKHTERESARNRLRNAAHRAGFGKRVRLQRLGMHGGISRCVARFARHGSGDGERAFCSSILIW